MHKLFLFVLFFTFSAQSEQSLRYKGESKSLIKWDSIEPSEWLDLSKWLNQLELKEKSPDWEAYSRDKAQRELLGKVIKCIGQCLLFRGLLPVQVEYLSQIREGDVLETKEGSFAWILLNDGSLVRMSSFTSLSFNEINFSEKEIFFYLRLGEGAIYLKSRFDEKFEAQELPQTDPIFLPLMVAQANLEYYQREDYKKLDTKKEQLLFHLNSKKGMQSMIDNLNGLISENSKKINRKTQSHFILVLPNVTVDTLNPHLNAVYTLGGESHLYSEAERPGQNSQYVLHLRGYDNKEKLTLENEKWLQLDSSGLNHKYIEDNRILNFLRFSHKRVPSLHLAREILLQPLISTLNYKDAPELATQYGFRFWKNEEMTKHIDFLLEYTRRVETTNLISLKKIIADSKIDAPVRELSDQYNMKAIVNYFNSISGMARNKHPFVQQYTEKEFYFWLIHYAKTNKEISTYLR